MTPRRFIIAGVSALLLFAALGSAWYIRVTREDPTPVPEQVPKIDKREPQKKVIGTSVEGRAIEAYTFGDGRRHLLFVGGMHGGYEWNSVVLAYRVLEYLAARPDQVPDGLTVSVIPNANPDGVYAVVGKEGRFSAAEVPEGTSAAHGRFNARGVDLNRNFACNWQPTSTWRGETVTAGSEPFSEPEARALRDYVLATEPDAVIFWHSQANAVYASECNEGILPETTNLMETYAHAAGYPAIDSFDHYEITGDAEGWLATLGIPAITVELSSHEAIEWERNVQGITALFARYGEARTLGR